MDYHFFIGPILGGIIGLITNGIAIKMLFRPLKAIYIFGFKLPFTPGLIPKEKNRIAKSLGATVGNTLVNEEVLKKGLLSETMLEKIKDALFLLVEKNRDSKESVRDLISKFLRKDQSLSLISDGKNKLVKLTYDRVNTMNLGERISEIAMEEILTSLQSSMFSMFINDGLIQIVQAKIEEIIDQIVEKQGEALLDDVIGNEVDNLLDLRICDLIKNSGEQIPRLINHLLESYKRLVNENIGRAVKALDISKLVEEKINDFDILEFEKIILEIMSKELNAIVLLGGLLGCIMGLLMSFI